MRYYSKPSWELAPKWATQLYKNISDGRYVFSDGKRATPRSNGTGQFIILLEMWNLVEERPVEDTTTKPSWDLAPEWATGLYRNKLNKVYAFSDGVLGTTCKDKYDTFTLRLQLWDLVEKRLQPSIPKPPEPKPAENSGGSCDYYKVTIESPTTSPTTYTAECNDIIEVLNMTYAEANMFKEIWRTAAARTLGKLKAGHDTKRGAEKIIFFAERHGVVNGIIR